MRETAEHLLRRAAVAAYELIDRDRGRAQGESGRMLELMRRHLFDPRLDVGWLLAGLKLSHNASSRFRAKIGVGPKRYLEQRRLETACRLLRDTELEVREIGKLVGYRRFAAFSHAFKQRLGRRPKGYRDARPPATEPPAAEPPAAEPPAAEPPAPIDVDEETRRAARQLSRHYGCSASEAVRRAVRHRQDAVVGRSDGQR